MTHYPVAYEGNEPYIFISYSHKDSQRVLPLIQGMMDQGFRVWYDKSIQIGSEFPEYIEQFLGNAQCVIPLMSENALESRFCRDEINFALNLDKDIIVAFLEKVNLKYGLGIRLSSRQAIFLDNYKTAEDFLQELCKAKLLQSCRCTQEKTPQAPVVERIQPSAGENAATERAAVEKAAAEKAATEKAAAERLEAYMAASRKAGETHLNQGIEYKNQGSFEAAENELLLAIKYFKADAYFHLYDLYSNNAEIFGEDKESKAMELLRKGAEAHSAPCQYELGRKLVGHHWNELTSKELEEGAYWYRNAAMRGLAKAQFAYAECLSRGRGVERNDSWALTYYEAAAKQNYIGAQNAAGSCYLRGQGVKRDIDKAEMWFQKALDQGNTDGCELLGKFYTNEKYNYKKAFEWYLKGAEKGNTLCMQEVADCYLKGKGVKMNWAESMKWKKAYKDAWKTKKKQ